ncbi:MAG: type 4a pilus biogenesis protein PilO [Polaromonas sp.]|nr:type 4a pilus biogenesis protein PilO [Polaromonas sp.]
MVNQLKIVWRGLWAMDRDAPVAWPIWLRQLACAAVGLASFGLLWIVWLSIDLQQLTRAEVTHERLRTEFSAKLLRASSLVGLKSQRSQLAQRLQQLETQLPGPYEMDVLFADMYHSGRARHLRFELLRPAELQRQVSYAHQRIALRVSGRYEDLAGFTADIAGLAWLVSIQSFTLAPTQDGLLSMDAVIGTLRPLETSPASVAKKATP